MTIPALQSSRRNQSRSSNLTIRTDDRLRLLPSSWESASNFAKLQQQIVRAECRVHKLILAVELQLVRADSSSVEEYGCERLQRKNIDQCWGKNWTFLLAIVHKSNRESALCEKWIVKVGKWGQSFMAAQNDCARALLLHVEAIPREPDSGGKL